MALSFLVFLQLLEEQQGLFSQIFTLSSLVLFFSVLFLLKHNGALSSKKSNNPPPSPPKIPIIGNLHQLGTLAHQSFRDMSHKYGPLMLLHMGQFPTLIVSSPEMATEIMKNQDPDFANRPFTTAAKAFLHGRLDIGFAPYGEYWRQVRKICVHELLSIQRVQSFRFVREEEVGALIKKISSSCSRGDVINLSEILPTISNNIVSRCTFGGKYEGSHENRFGQLSRQAMKLMGAFCFADFFPSLGWLDFFTGLTGKLKRTSQELDSFFDKVIDEHLLPKSKNHSQQEDKEDLIDILLLAQKDNSNLSRDSIKALIMDMFVGGSDTTATTMEWAMAELIKNPKLMKKAQDEVRRVIGKKSKIEEDDINQMDYLRCIIKETLRLHSPLPTLVPRQSFNKSTKVQGYDIPPNTRVFINAWAIHRDSKLWDNAEEFRPERFINNPIDFRGQEFHYIPFGSGRRVCPAISFGLASLEFVLANLLYWFDWELPSGENRDELDMSEALGLTVTKKIPLHVVPTLKNIFYCTSHHNIKKKLSNKIINTIYKFIKGIISVLMQPSHARMAPSLLVFLQLLEAQQVSFLQIFILSILVLFFSVFFLLKLHGAWSSKKSNNPPPSPPKIPIIGNLHQLGTLPHRSFRDMSHKYGPLMLLHMGQFQTLIVSSPEMATEIMKNQDLVFANRPFTAAAKAFLYGCIDIGFAPYGEYWRQVRKICVLELLSIKRVQSFRFVREEEVTVLIQKISSSCSRGDVINLSEMLLTVSNNIVSRCALGAKYEGAHENRFGELSRQAMKLMGAFSFADFFPSLRWMDVVTGLSGRLKRVSQELDTFLDQVIDEHLLPKSKNHNQQEDKEDLIDILLLAQKDNTNLARDNIKAIILDMFVGGSDTTATTIEWAMAELIKNPKLMKKAQDEVRRVIGKKSKVDEDDINQMDYLRCIVKESLRLHAPIPTLVPRESSKSTKIEEEFRPERFINNPIDFRGQEFQFIPFGSGRRGCPGVSFGLAVLEFVIANLLYWFDWELPSGTNRDELDMTEAFGLTVNKKIPLHVVPTFHSAS
ncbi:Cytochrome P450 [Macleaya cordata]|uniref:Cytochrome P450 n=1 Tax=Macleaya cordata TaxID=56857 RepID=A0A200RCX5_MACCD|nr:Cytochrome P450 [Macleaya cordata]